MWSEVSGMVKLRLKVRSVEDRTTVAAVASGHSVSMVERYPGQKHIVVIQGRCECIRNVSLRHCAKFYFLGEQNVKL